jgi:hypothetical protein
VALWSNDLPQRSARMNPAGRSVGSNPAVALSSDRTDGGAFVEAIPLWRSRRMIRRERFRRIDPAAASRRID